MKFKYFIENYKVKLFIGIVGYLLISLTLWRCSPLSPSISKIQLPFQEQNQGIENQLPTQLKVKNTSQQMNNTASPALESRAKQILTAHHIVSVYDITALMDEFDKTESMENAVYIVPNEEQLDYFITNKELELKLDHCLPNEIRTTFFVYFDPDKIEALDQFETELIPQPRGNWLLRVKKDVPKTVWETMQEALDTIVLVYTP